jgi:hypothetical protein
MGSLVVDHQTGFESISNTAIVEGQEVRWMEPGGDTR